MNNNLWEELHDIRINIPLGFHSYVTIMLNVKLAKRESNGDNEKAIAILAKNNLGLQHHIGDASIYERVYYCLKDVNVFDCLQYIGEKSSKFEWTMQTPAVIKEWFEEKINSSKCNNVLIPEGEHYIYDLREIATSNPDKTFTIGTTYVDFGNLLKLEYEGCYNIKVVELNIYEDIRTIEKFDLITAIPIFGGRKMVDEGKNICREFDLVALENLLPLLSTDGSLNIVLPAKITFAGATVAKLRRYIESNYSIAEIRELPTGIFYYSGVKTFYFEFTTKQNENILISTYNGTVDKKTKIMNISCSAEQYISREELFSQENWQVNHLLSPISDLLQSFYNSPIKKVKIKDVAEIFRGKAVNNKSTDGNIAVINISNINEYGIDYSNLECFEDEERKVKRYELQEGDVLLTCRGTTIKAATFKQQDKICIPAVSLVVIRPNSELNSKFLEIFFQTTVGKAIFDGFSSGETSIMIKHTDVMEITIPLPSLEKQNEIVEYYEREKSIYLDSIKAAKERWEKTQNEFLNSLN